MSRRMNDVERYRARYPGQQDDTDMNDNLRFYRGEIKCRPNMKTIDEIHASWRGEYQLLELEHGYIQWLFPIREQGLNDEANPLQLHEAQAIAYVRQADEQVELITISDGF
jgi:hypothetical protein